MNGRTSGTFARMGPARAQARRDRLLYVGGGSVMVVLIALAVLLLTNRSTVEARSNFQPLEGAEDELAYNMVVLLAPTAEVPKGTKVGRVSLERIHWPRDQVPEGAVRETEKIQDMFTKVPLRANQPIIRTDLSAQAPQFGIMDYLPPGHRAVTIEVDATAGVEGWATPGAHVDVLLTYIDKAEGGSTTRVAVEDAIVLSYDGSTTVTTSEAGVNNNRFRQGNSGRSTVTLMVSLEEALQLQTAKNMGKINLVLRNVSDTTIVTRTEFKERDWDKKAVTKKVEKKNLGYVSFSDKRGQDKTFVIKEDNSWWEQGGANADDDFGG